MILLIVCVNLSNLLLARAAARSKEFAMRSALGADRGRLVRQLLTESLILSGAGAMLGLGIALGVMGFLAHQGSIALPLLSDAADRWSGAGVDGGDCDCGGGVLFGLMPGLRMASGNLQETLKDSGHGASAGRRHEGLRSALVVAEVALACVLLVGAGLLLRSFLRMLDVDLGFAAGQAAAISVDYRRWAEVGGKRSANGRRSSAQVEAIPGVETAGISGQSAAEPQPKLGHFGEGGGVSAGRVAGDVRVYRFAGISEGDGDAADGGAGFSMGRCQEPAAVIINETVARKLWPGQDPIGRIALAGGTDARVIGVIADVHESSVEGEAGWQMYLPVTSPKFGPEGAELVVRSTLPAGTLAASVMATLR